MRTITVGAILIGVIALGGCSAAPDRWTQQRPKVIPVTGRVLYRGVPVPGADVTFRSAEANRSAFGRTDAAGRFVLTTFNSGDGAVLGEQQVSIHKVEVTNLAPVSADPIADQTVVPIQERWLVPQRYATPETSELTAVVIVGGTNDFSFELTD